MTLNQIAAAFCDAVNKPFDFQYNERIKFSIKYWRATLIRQDAERNGISRDTLQFFIAPLINVDATDSCIVDLGCPILRTKNRVPKPVRVKGGNLFRYVGSVNIQNQPFVEVDAAELQYAKYKKYTSKAVRYIYVNGYIYIYTDGKFKHVRIDSIFAEPEKAMNLCAESCASDDDEYPISADMISIIFKGLISGEMQIQTTNIDTSQREDD